MKGTRKIQAAAGMALAGALVLAMHAPISSAQVGATHIDAFDVEGPFEHDLDLGKPGFGTSGDVVLESQHVLNPVDGSRIGRVISQLTIIRPVSHGQDFEVVVSSTFRLADGDVVVAGGLRLSELFAGGSIAVVGGTGMFAGARGTATGTAATVAGTDGVLFSIDITTG